MQCRCAFHRRRRPRQIPRRGFSPAGEQTGAALKPVLVHMRQAGLALCDAVDGNGKSDAWRSIVQVGGGREVQSSCNKRMNRLTEWVPATDYTEGPPSFTKGEGKAGRADVALRGCGRSDVRGASGGGRGPSRRGSTCSSRCCRTGRRRGGTGARTGCVRPLRARRERLWGGSAPVGPRATPSVVVAARYLVAAERGAQAMMPVRV